MLFHFLKKTNSYDKAFIILAVLLVTYSLLTIDYPLFGQGDLNNDFLVAKNAIQYGEFPVLGPGNGIFNWRLNSFTYYYVIIALLFFYSGSVIFLSYFSIVLSANESHHLRGLKTRCVSRFISLKTTSSLFMKSLLIRI